MVLNMTFLKEAFLAQFCFHYKFPPHGNINHHQVNYSSFFADDTQLYISVSPNDPTALHVLIACLTDINVWMSKYLTKAKLRKKQLFEQGPKKQEKKLLGGLSKQIRTNITKLILSF